MTSSRIPSALLIGAAVAVMAACVWVVGQTQRDAASQSVRQTEQAQAMLTAMVDQETGLRGYLLNGGGREFLTPFLAGEQDFQHALRTVRSLGGDDEIGALLDRSEDLAARWRTAAEAAAARGHANNPLSEAKQRMALMEAFRLVNASLRRALD